MAETDNDGADELAVDLAVAEMIQADEELGPIDYIVVEFPAGQSTFTGEAAEELALLVAGGTVRVLDLVIVRKNEDGSIEVDEFDDLDDLGPLGTIEATLAEVLAEEDLVHIAAAMEPGSTAGWCGRTRGRRRSPWRCAATADSSSLPAGSRPRRSSRRCRTKENDMPIGIGRVGRVGMIGRPVARTAAVVGTAKVVSNGIDRRQDRRQDRRERRF